MNGESLVSAVHAICCRYMLFVAGLLDQFVSVQVHSTVVSTYSDGGRICRPLLLIDQESTPIAPCSSSVTSRRLNVAGISIFDYRGLVEFVTYPKRMIVILQLIKGYR